jgi:hypothetical protein
MPCYPVSMRYSKKLEDARIASSFPKLSKASKSYLFHDTSFTLGECDMATRFVLNKLDINLSSLASRLVVIIVIVVACRCTDASTLHSTRIATLSIAGRKRVVVSRRRMVVVGFSDFTHFCCFVALFCEYYAASQSGLGGLRRVFCFEVRGRKRKSERLGWAAEKAKSKADRTEWRGTLVGRTRVKMESHLLVLNWSGPW